MTAANFVLDAVGDSTRRDILRLLAEKPQSVGDLAGRLPVSRPAVSQHLRVLSNADLVSAEAQGTRRVYRLDGSGAAEGRAFFDSLWTPPSTGSPSLWPPVLPVRLPPVPECAPYSPL